MQGGGEHAANAQWIRRPIRTPGTHPNARRRARLGATVIAGERRAGIPAVTTTG